MRNLFRFLARNYFFLLFLAFESFCMILIVNYNNYQKVQFFNSSNRISASIYKMNSSVFGYFQLKQVNTELADEIAILRNQLQKYSHPEIALHVDSLTALNDSTLYLQTDSAQFRYIPAKVINNSTNKQHNYITLNKGRKDGIEPDMGIIGPGGVVGIITNVSDNYSTGPTILNTRWRVSAKIKKNDYFGPLSWEGVDPLSAELNEIPYHVELSVGDTIVTSGYSSVFPEGIPIGWIQSFNRESGDNFHKINIRLSTTFMTLSHIEVIENFHIEELTTLQENETNE